ncbi:hypothetical protein PHACT_12615 [Pseudohongiella acticola]|uniref:Uncharacterized protein n=1 Tax=Pseudohongiella acticola TaxID=1524254 RepID=A0A1E8CG52_9GAMM|nr:hypothetical protein [Pseudohongiella acticola]OFE11393.1 hypothetical protein PHACT_12615 [Pseudohongiella acticola]
MVNISNRQFDRMVKAIERSARQTERLTAQVDQLLHINHQLLDIVVAGEMDEQEEHGSGMFLDGSDA